MLHPALRMVLRINFRKILRSKSLSRGFTEAEKHAMRQVVQGTTGANLAKIVGKLGFDKNNALLPMLGIASGATLGPVGAIAPIVAGAAGRKASEKLTANAANKAMRLMAVDKVKSVPLIDQAKPTVTELLLRGTAPTYGR